MPVNILTGFLGSGKTTLLKQALNDEVLSGAAVLINEFGEVGLDHLLLERLDENVVLLRGGCVCCSIRGDVARALRSLNDRQGAGEIPPFTRVVIETSGLSDPLPVLATLMHEPNIRYHFRPGALVATVDAVNAARRFHDTGEAVRQVALADRIVITKKDIASAAQLSEARRMVAGINATAPVCIQPSPELDIGALFSTDVYDPRTRGREVEHWLVSLSGEENHNAALAGQASPADSQPHGPDGKPHGHDHASRAQTMAIRLDEPVDWNAFGVWLSLLLHRHGDKIMRTKGILNVRGTDMPVVVHGVQNLVHPPTHLSAWPGDDRASTLVFIARDMDLGDVKQSLVTFLKRFGR
ncbi:MAG: GTP-binding protein [Hyphomicrobiales bacterium]